MSENIEIALCSRKRLPNDVSRCPGTRCDVRHLCARHTSECRAPVSMMDFSVLGPVVQRTELCGNFISSEVEDAA